MFSQNQFSFSFCHCVLIDPERSRSNLNRNSERVYIYPPLLRLLSGERTKTAGRGCWLVSRRSVQRTLQHESSRITEVNWGCNFLRSDLCPRNIVARCRLSSSPSVFHCYDSPNPPRFSEEESFALSYRSTKSLDSSDLSLLRHDPDSLD